MITKFIVRKTKQKSRCWCESLFFGVVFALFVVVVVVVFAVLELNWCKLKQISKQADKPTKGGIGREAREEEKAHLIYIYIICISFLYVQLVLLSAQAQHTNKTKRNQQKNAENEHTRTRTHHTPHAYHITLSTPLPPPLDLFFSCSLSLSLSRSYCDYIECLATTDLEMYINNNKTIYNIFGIYSLFAKLHLTSHIRIQTRGIVIFAVALFFTNSFHLFKQEMLYLKPKRKQRRWWWGWWWWWWY